MKGITQYLYALAMAGFGVVLWALTSGFGPGGGNGINTSTQLRWSPNSQLKWSDFKGSPERFTYMDAMTESGIVFTWKCDYRGFQFEVYAMFDTKKSWVRKSEASEHLLRHEQAHFDITEWHARKLRKRLSDISNPCRMGRSGIDRIAQQIYNESSAMQELYDTETSHSKNFAAQKKWLERIRKELQQLEAYAE